MKIETCNELTLQLEKGCVTLKETDTAEMETTELCTESTGILTTYLGLNFTRTFINRNFKDLSLCVWCVQRVDPFWLVLSICP